ncbi:Zn-dependent exopeptidase [Pholiota conissans]|uniref:Zn-dependent exopeptidase n=1 Tax=Pholiota conissans TaxID=109636 RepID=A0A9P6D011_9AGAR|nr:Zn-dependent exopeptidase [Pholiota conissans]
MDIEKQPSTKEFEHFLPLRGINEAHDGSNLPPRRRQLLRKTLGKFVGVLVLLLFVRTISRRFILQPASSARNFPHPHRHLSVAEREKLFLSVPSTESALEASRAYATHPHLAGSSEDFLDAKVILHLFQDEFNIPKPLHLPIFPAGTPESRNATLLLTERGASTRPTAWIDTYYPVMNTGVEQSLEILATNGSTVWTADLVEDGDPRDPEAHKYKDTIPAWHGLSCDGDVTGQLIYANYGRKEDYDELVAQGTNFTGKIVLTRYGANFRGLKIKGAQELGALGVLIYSDPRDDGFVTTKNDYSPYPAGPARNPSSVQRGSVQYLSSYPGDPTTPGYPAYEDAERTEGSNIPKIPSLPISWKNAERLLAEISDLYVQTEAGKKRLSGQASETSVHLVNHVDTKVTPIWNAMASIPGHIKDEVVVIGCHRDAWVMGAADPTSGTVSLHEIIRGYGELLRKGWKPLRTIIIASWDAEEYGLIGSTEWGEDFAPWISNHVVAYLNVDVSVAGSTLGIAGSPSLAHIIKQTALDVPHPTDEKRTLWDALDDEGPFKQFAQNGTADADFLELYYENRRKLKASNTRVRPLGSGSDFTVFLQHIGVASSDQGFSGGPSDAPYHYHSIYDSQAWQERYGDPGFYRHVAVAQYLGLLGLRLTDSIILPLNTTQYSLELEDYLDEVESRLPSLGKPEAEKVKLSALRSTIQAVQESSLKLDAEKAKAEEEFTKLLRRLPFPGRRGIRQRRRRMGSLRRVADWIKGVFGVPPPTEEELQLLSLRSAESWEEYLEYVSIVGVDSFDNLDDIEPKHGCHGLPLDPIRKFIKAAKRVVKANQKLRAFERGFISEGGIKDREWYKHLGVAPGKWLGYGATTFPGLTEAITFEKNVTLIHHEANRLEVLLKALATAIEP